jgi:hypothetical protein
MILNEIFAMDSLTFYFDPVLREQFKTGNLIDSWFVQYPRLFDAMDLEIAKNQRGIGKDQRTYHFYEWLAAILIFHTTGYLSLIEQYEFKRHSQKRNLLHRLVSQEVFDIITNHSEHFNRLQCPDLLVYAPDFSNWYFCEAKGPQDKIRPQQKLFFEKLEKVSGKPIQLIRLIESR